MRLMAAITLALLWACIEESSGDSGNLTSYEEPEVRGPQTVKSHSRRRRYIVFPRGSSLQLILELLVHVPTQFRVLVGPTLQVAWPLPSVPSQCFRSRRSSPSEASHLRRRLSHSKTFFTSPGKTVFTGRTLAGSKHKVLSDVANLLDLFGMTVGLAWQLPDDPMVHSEFKKKHKVYKRNVLKKMETFMSKPWGANGRQCVLKALCESGQRTPSKKEFLTEILHKIFSVEAKEQGVEESPEDEVYWRAHQSLNQNCQTLYPECHFSLFDSMQ